jgi:hypothetical protein
LQLEKSLSRAELTQGKYCGNIERAPERLTQTDRTETTMIVILRVVIRVLIANGLGGVRQQARRRQNMSIGYELTGTADFNGGGSPDYVLYNPNTRRTALYHLNNNVYAAAPRGRFFRLAGT